jgi:hypothetical protein
MRPLFSFGHHRRLDPFLEKIGADSRTLTCTPSGTTTSK